MQNLSIEDFNAKLESYKKNRLNFEYIETKSTTYIKVGTARIYKDRKSIIPQDELYIFNQVQKEADAFLQAHPEHRGRVYDIKYCIANGHPDYTQDTVYNNCIEIDISAAYTAAALKLGIITRKTYKKLQSMSKGTRLAALGSIASSKKITVYKKGEAVQDIFDEKATRPLFFLAALEVQKLLLPLMEKQEEILFCWVDAIFAPKELEPVLCYKIAAAGYKFKIKRGLDIKLQRDKNNILYHVHDPKQPNPEEQNRTFTFNRQNFKTIFNSQAAKERSILEYIKTQTDGADPAKLFELECLLTDKIARTFGTVQVDKLPIFKIATLLNSKGLRHTDFLNIKKRAAIDIEEMKINFQKSEFYDLVKYSIVADIMEGVGQEEKQETFFVASNEAILETISHIDTLND